MHLHDINLLLNLQGVTINSISEVIEKTVYIYLEPKNSHQPCPYCGSNHTIKRGKSKPRYVKHLDIWENSTILVLPTIRLSCKFCDANFTWVYDFVESKSKYTNAFKQMLSNSINGATVKYSTRIYKIPYTSAERFIKKNLNQVVPELQKQAISTAKNSNRLVIGIDDFAIRKGHSYNTGFHDLRNDTLLRIVKGRRNEELLSNESLLKTMNSLSPVAVVMDLAKSYHNFAKEIFPEAIRIADHFHVNRYITDALQSLRKRISKTLSSYNIKFLKQNKKILEKRNDALNSSEKKVLKKILLLSSELEKAYWCKENLIDWYDYSNSSNAYTLLERWINEGENLNIPELNEALKTFRNWKVEISNYHKCRFTNAAVEGRNNKIKALQRRCYFLRNRKVYEQRIYLECNSEVLTA